MWAPKNINIDGSVSTQNTKHVPEVELPSIGDTIMIMATPYNHVIVREGMHIPNGSNVYEVEVIALKKAKVILE